MEERAEEKKFPCPDCRFCQWCPDDRCRICRGERKGCGRKLSTAEQIELYERINRKEPHPHPIPPLEGEGT